MWSLTAATSVSVPGLSADADRAAVPPCDYESVADLAAVDSASSVSSISAVSLSVGWRACSFEKAEVELENDQRGLRHRVA